LWFLLLPVCALIFGWACIGPARAQSVDPNANETKAQKDARMKWWREARFGMFIHWGSYCVPAGMYHGQQIGGLGEWIMHTAHIPVAEYETYAPQFDPEQFNADSIVALAKAAGMKYIVITAKHHEGFAMFHTAVDKYNIYDSTKFHRDVIAEMSAACKRAGIKFGVYYSQNLDWHHPGGGTAGPPWDDAQKGDFDNYVRTVSAPQVTELLTKYHPAVLWWDINGPFTPDQVRLLTASFKDDPGLISNNRLGGGVPGDTETPEQFIPATGFKGRDWETCMTINDTWGYKSYDMNFKPTSVLLHNLIDIASKGGNYLLNIGPEPSGIVPPGEVQRLQEIGKWMSVNGESIYATTASPYKRLPFDGRCTVKGNTLYVNVFTWPDAGLTLKGLQNKVISARAVAGGQKLAVDVAADGTVTVGKPDKIDPISTAIAIKLDGPPAVSEPEVRIAPQPDGSFKLNAADSTVDGDTAKLEGAGDASNIGYWLNQSDKVDWKINAPTGGTYSANLVYACDPGSGGSTFTLQVDGTDSGVSGTVAKTTGWQDYTTLALDGKLTLTSGPHTIAVVPKSKPGEAVMNLRTIVLAPAK
jgi:alpha-L-fucosidase